MSHCSVLQNKVDELIDKGATELSAGGAGFYFNASVVPRCRGVMTHT